ncbi:DUF899 domain-containing protein [Brevibacterium casei]|uniref:Thioredoxin n=1 Tax=Brevibacterium casei TaxID=33889 RepID=A0AB34XU98_9MICO|nr:DUF899 domain-containing protein [Brevibacterium casei]SII18882.1 CalU12 protein [Mycobacteroides abscessus subsp. abscessus]KZE22554.1 hypothetical protein AVW13_07695 [Brevibacterium casei]MCT1446796.1 DUF899 domain-containing protein [Brevibacterium casei]MCT2181926.1 DUF899 domain-containing protein [Brevibacterium casei]MCT2357918.1 DUF899 domain-containing protein [Brevibacterium casei]
MSIPEIVDEATWREARRRLLEKEKDLTAQIDRLNAERRRLPMVPVTKDYRFEGPDGDVGLRDLFGDHRQLIVQHFMFDPAWDAGCSSCTAMASSAAHPAMLDQLAGRGTAFAAVSRAPLSKLVAYREAKGWSFPWVSSAGSDFNLDFHVTLDPDLAPNSYNFRDGDELIAADQEWLTTYRGEQPGISTFLRDGDDVFHTYSVYARGLEVMMPAYGMLDLTALGRQESWEEPAGRAPAFYRHDAGVLNPEVVDA